MPPPPALQLTEQERGPPVRPRLTLRLTKGKHNDASHHPRVAGTGSLSGLPRSAARRRLSVPHLNLVPCRISGGASLCRGLARGLGVDSTTNETRRANQRLSWRRDGAAMGRWVLSIIEAGAFVLGCLLIHLGRKHPEAVTEVLLTLGFLMIFLTGVKLMEWVQ